MKGIKHSAVELLLCAAVMAGCSPVTAATPPLTNAVPITPTTLPSPTPISTQAGGTSSRQWATLENYTNGTSFEYPAVYDQPPLNSICQPQPISQWATVFAEVIHLDIFDADTRDLAAYVAQYIKYLIVTEADFELLSKSDGKQNGLEKIVIEYSSVRPEQHTIITFFIIDHYAHQFQYTEGSSSCDLPELGLTVHDIYDHAVDTFKLMD